VWLRRDLRLDDNHALFEAARSSRSLCTAFVVDPQLLRSERMGGPLVQCFFGALRALREQLRALGGDLVVLLGDPSRELAGLQRRIGASAIFYNEDYEPPAIVRDVRVTEAMRAAGVAVHAFVDHVYFGAEEVCRPDGAPYAVFSAYKRRWLDRRAIAPRAPFPSLAAARGQLLPLIELGASEEVPSPGDFGFTPSRQYPIVSEAEARSLFDRFVGGEGIARYRTARDFPAQGGTSHLSPQLRAGTIGIRTCVEEAAALQLRQGGAERAGVETWISELIWRDFYQMILKVHPRVTTAPFVERARNIVWREANTEFDAWCSGTTGYPIVDAGMRQLNESGWMHNRLRMIVASFLTKHLLIDWRRGERYFEQRLADADLAANNGGWQWSSSTGTDAAPYFRIFNPIVQSERFDPSGAFIRSMIPELANVPPAYVHAPWTMPPMVAAEAGVRIGSDYPMPIVDHAAARTRALQAYSVLRG
jgi:deoxyribodipyrimidine photo-lyase